MVGEENPTNDNQGLTRRDLLRRGAALGGAVVWMTPIVQTVGVGRAFAQSPSPEPCTPAISYIAMNVTCGGTDYFIKWEAGGSSGSWEIEPGNAPGCNFTPTGTKIRGSDLGFGATPSGENSQVIISVPANCTVNAVAVKGGQNCDLFNGPLTGNLRFTCPRNPGTD